MTRWLGALVLGVVLGSLLEPMARGYTQGDRVAALKEIALDAGGGTAFKVPKGYGRLINVAVSAEVHHLYFLDHEGTIRIVLLGPRGASQRARHAFQLLSSQVYRVERGDVTEQ